MREVCPDHAAIGGDHAHCGTFVEISFRGGLGRNGMVGACHRSECRHNENLECTPRPSRSGRTRTSRTA
ncbi:hypothetical protein ACQP04_27435 [Pseudonocardia halophobica]|uniref:hypothetical protein n=1 Tax=Pseudonocardia halophobica TaxID=29401 RepID=UPI003D8B7524